MARSELDRLCKAPDACLKRMRRGSCDAPTGSRVDKLPGPPLSCAGHGGIKQHVPREMAVSPVPLVVTQPCRPHRQCSPRRSRSCLALTTRLCLQVRFGYVLTAGIY